MISIVIPTYNSVETLIKCVNALLDQDFHGDYEIIVTDDGSTDQTQKSMSPFCKADKHVHYLWHENVQRAGNRNVGVSISNGEILIFLDADMLPVRSFISSHVAVLDEIGKRGIICGAIPVAGSYNNSPFGRYMIGKWARRLDELKILPNDPFLMQSGNFSIHKEFFDELGGFDESFCQYGGEDIDFFIRALEMGALFRYSETALAYQQIEVNFTSYALKYSQALTSSRKLMDLHPKYFVSKIEDKQGDWKDDLWKKWIHWKHSYPIMMFLLPIIEKLPDHKIFFVYNSLLAHLRYHPVI